MIFDGKQFAHEIEEEVSSKVRNLVKKPRVVSVMVGDDPASALYTRLKQQAAERVGIQFDVVKLESTNIQIPIIKQRITEIGAKDDVTGVMVQLPIPGPHGEASLQGQALQDLLTAIPLAKDIDGLRWEESHIMPATVRAVLEIVEKIEKDSGFKIQDLRVIVVGARGAVGRPLVHYLRERGVQEVLEVEWDTPEPTRTVLEGDVVISCVGKPGLVTGEMVKPGVIAVDVGISQIPIQNSEFVVNGPKTTVVGDMTQDVYEKASVAVAVPGGVGPVTIACLMENAVSML